MKTLSTKAPIRSGLINENSSVEKLRKKIKINVSTCFFMNRFRKKLKLSVNIISH